MSQDELTEEFLTLYNQQQRRIYAYIRTLLYRPDDAEEVFQETCIALWRSFDQFQAGSNFGAWAREIARHRVLAYGKKRQGDRHVFSVDTLNRVADDVREEGEIVELRQQALSSCLSRLSAADRELLNRRYAGDTTTVELAENTGRSLNTLYKSLRRIRRSLLECIRLTLKSEEHAT